MALIENNTIQNILNLNEQHLLIIIDEFLLNI